MIRQADIDAGRRDGLTSAEREELAQLRWENRQLREDVGDPGNVSLRCERAMGLADEPPTVG